MHGYAQGLGPANRHIPHLKIALSPDQPLIYADSLEPNKEGIWIHVFRTIFFHRDRPIASLDQVSVSTPPVCVTPGSLPPEKYLRPADIAPLRKSEPV